MKEHFCLFVVVLTLVGLWTLPSIRVYIAVVENVGNITHLELTLIVFFLSLLKSELKLLMIMLSSKHRICLTFMVLCNIKFYLKSTVYPIMQNNVYHLTFALL